MPQFGNFYLVNLLRRHPKQLTIIIILRDVLKLSLWPFELLQLLLPLLHDDDDDDYYYSCSSCIEVDLIYGHCKGFHLSLPLSRLYVVQQVWVKKSKKTGTTSFWHFFKRLLTRPAHPLRVFCVNFKLPLFLNNLIGWILLTTNQNALKLV